MEKGSTVFPNIDFSFRRGYKDAFQNTPILNGSLNFIKDTRELFVDIDDSRILISSIVFDGGTEADIKALPVPENKIYITSDTFKLLYFDRHKMKWHVVGTNIVENAENANKAIMDSKGNVITDYYYSATDAAADYQNMLTEIRNLSDTVSNIIRFGVKLLNDESELPIEGSQGIIYFIPITNYSGGFLTNDNEEGSDNVSKSKDIYIELLWIVDPDFGGYYEIIGNTTVDLSNFYNKSQIDDMMNALRLDLNNSLDGTRADMVSAINNLRTLINSYQSSDTTKFNALGSKIEEINSAIASLSNTVNTNKTNTDKDISDLATVVANNKTDTDKDISDLTTSINNQIAKVKEDYLYASLINEG